MKSGIDFASILKQKTESEEQLNDENMKTDIISATENKNTSTESKFVTENVEGKQKNQPDEEKRLLKELESSSIGKIKGSLAMHYIKSSNQPFIATFVIASFLFAQFLASFADIFVSYWIRQEEIRSVEAEIEIKRESFIGFNASTLEESTDEMKSFMNRMLEDLTSNVWSTETYAYIYTGIIVALFVIAFVRSWTFYRLTRTISQNLHDSMFHGLVSTTMRFFDLNPSGRIMNRFSKDMGTADEMLPKAIFDAGQLILSMTGAVLVTVYTNPIFSIVILVMAIFFWNMRKIYLQSSTNIKRLEGTSEYTRWKFFPEMFEENIF